MSKRLVILSIVTMLATPGAVTAQTVSPEAQSMRVTAERTNLRDRAAIDGAIVASLSKGDELEVIDVAGSWYHVRIKSTGKVGYVSSLLVEALPGRPTAQVSQPAASSKRPTESVVTPARTPPMRAATTTSAGSVVDDRRLGLGLGGGGLAWGLTPSARYWLNEKMGVEVIAAFYPGATAISPSILFRFGEPTTGTARLLPYFGGGATFFLYDLGLASYRSVGFGGFAGTELVFDAVPQLALSGNVGFYTSPANLSYGAIFTTVGVHWYFK